jgi:antitoxin component of MazEF toxin-antitoxin module
MGMISIGDRVTMRKHVGKVIQLGGSLGIEIPEQIARALDIKQGDEMVFKFKSDVIVLQKKHRLKVQGNEETLKMLQETFEEHDELFKRLK